VFTRFENHELAEPHTGCSHYSGKWNFHYHDWDLERAVNDFRQNLARVATIPDEAARGLLDACKRAVSEVWDGEQLGFKDALSACVIRDKCWAAIAIAERTAA
jgi:hypothetical protein